MIKLTTATAGVFLAAGMAQAAVIDFEEFANGEAVNQVSAGGVTATVTVDSNGAFDQAVAFDTDLDNTADPDLEAPFFTTQGGSINPGKILIISEDGGADDERFGGTITFEFSQPVNFLSFEAFDDGIFDVSSAKGDFALFGEDILLEDNESGFLAVDGFDAVTFLTFNFQSSGKGASGGIDNLTFETAPAPIPVPAALPLLAAGLGGLAFLGRRRRT